MKQKIFGFIEANNKKIILFSLVINFILLYFLLSNNTDGSIVIADTAERVDNISNVVKDISTPKTIITIEVVGEVQNPGIYKISKPIMVLEAIDLAGGLSAKADMDYIHKTINLSKAVGNNEKIYIPSYTSTNSSNSISNSGLINLNTSSIEELDTLPGVGVVTAQKIIDSRPYSSVEDLKNADGISATLYNKIVTLITI